LSKTLARSISASFKRLQFTPDLLPSDITGVSIYSQKDQLFHFHEGPIFANIVLADEINRASPRTQSALLEAMGEKQVSVDGTLRKLEELFFVIATQNPVEFRGTFPLPEAQMDRFALHISLGYVKPEEEISILSDRMVTTPLDTLESCATVEEILTLRHNAANVRISEEIKRYIVDLVSATRKTSGVQLGASPRASLALMKVAQAKALMEGRAFVAPEQIQQLAIPVIAHRLVLDSQAKFSGQTARSIVSQIVDQTPAPS
jgi:MoxR-like ATPase